MARHFSTVIEFINFGKVNANAFGNGVIEFEGFNSIGDGGASRWQRAGVTGLTPSRTPTNLDANEFTDAVGDKWELIPSQIITFNGVQFLPLPFGSAGNGGYYFNGTEFVFLASAADEAAAAAASAAAAQVSAQRAEDAAASIEGQLTTTQLIASSLTLDVGETVQTNGFYAAGDGGGALWVKTANTNTPSQTPAQLGDAILSDSLGNEWSFVGNALFTERLGCKLDGVTDDSGAFLSCKAWSNRVKGNVYSGVGTLLTSQQIVVNNEYFSLIGISKSKSIIKLDSGVEDNLMQVTNNGDLSVKNITLDQNMEFNSVGHGLRSGGCAGLRVDDTIIQNCNSYGIGFQAGSAKNVKITNSTIQNTGRDSIDIKDYDLANDTVMISNVDCINYGLSETQQVAIDVRGPVEAVNINCKSTTGNYGIRFRQGGVQGRAGFGSFSNVNISSIEGQVGAIALDMASDNGNCSVDNVTIADMEFAFRSSPVSTGGTISNVNASNISGTDCFILDGSDWLLNNIKVKNTSESSRVLDVEPTASNIRMANVNLTDNSVNPPSGRIQAGASNIQIEGGFVAGGTIADLGTNSVVNVTYL